MLYPQDQKALLKKRPLVSSIAMASMALAVASPQATAATSDASSKQASEPRLEMVVVQGQATGGLDSLISLEDLEKAQADDLADIFKLDPSVSVGGSIGMGQKIYVRNTGEDMLNISVDGAEQAGAVFHHSGRIAIEPELLKQVEVEAGTGSATAGPGALGGSVRFTTKDPEDLLKANESAGALIKTSYFGNGDVIKNSATVFGRSDSGVISAMASVIHTDGNILEDGNGDNIIGSESDQSLGYFKVVAQLSDEQYLSFSYEDLNEEGDILYKPELIAHTRNVAEPTEGSRKTAIVNYRFDSADNDLLNLQVNVYQTEQEQEREYSGIAYDGGVETFGINIKNTSVIANHELIYGLNYRDDKSYLNDVDFMPSYFEETGDVKGLFIQDIVQFSDMLTVTAGLRFDDYALEDVDGQKITDSGFSPNLSANFALSSNWAVSAGYAQALRGAEIKDSFKISTASNEANLKAEKASNLELGVNYNSDALQIALGVYQATIENPIAGAVPWSKVSENLSDDIETDGFFISADYQWQQLTLRAAFNSADTELNNEVVTRYVYSSSGASTGDNLVLSADYQFSESFVLGWSAQIVEGIHDIKLNVGGEALTVDKPGYSTHDVYLRWLPLESDLLSLNLMVKNIGSKQYLSHASVEDFQHNPGYGGIAGSPEVGRDIRLSATLRF